MERLGLVSDRVYQQLIDRSPELKRGLAWCLVCGHDRTFDPIRALKTPAWPVCCGQAMTLESPDERYRMATLDERILK